MALLEKPKHPLAWLKSFFTPKPVITGQGFTTTDDSLPNEIKLERSLYPGVVRYMARPGEVFLMVGTFKISNRVVYRLKNESTGIEFNLGRELFESLFIKF